MQVNFGFLSGSRTFEASLPDYLAAMKEAVSVVTYNGVPRSVQWGDSRSAGDLVETAELVYQETRRGPSSIVDVYAQFNPQTGEREFTILKFRPDNDPPGFGHMWIVFEDAVDGRPVEDVFVENFMPVVDRFGIARFRVTSPLGLGDQREPIDRDRVIYYPAKASGPAFSVSYTNAGAFARDAASRAADMSLVTVASDHGVTVTCDGPDDDATLAALRDSVPRLARGVARAG
jgi:hypothetical protein